MIRVFFDWIGENIGSILVLLGVVGFVGILMFGLIRSKIKAASSPGGCSGCAGCPHAASCHSAKSVTDDNTAE